MFGRETGTFGNLERPVSEQVSLKLSGFHCFIKSLDPTTN